MSRQIRFAALLLAVSLLCNIALPAMAVESVGTPVSASDGETTAPTEETTAPTEETTAPTEETTVPSEETIAVEEISYPMPFEQPEDNTLYITTARELLRLSYVEPQEYCCLTLVFDPGDEGDAVFDLATETDDPEFLGLGSEEYPFQGEVLFAEEAGPIALTRPLFNVLSDDAKITGLSLESRVQGAREGGLLAQTVTHGQGGSTWSIILTESKPAKNAEFNLLPLISELGNDADISLDITDLSKLPVLGSGYLCAVMGENARIMLSGVQSIPLVTGEGNEVGGLVGQMKTGAGLTVQGESIILGGVSGSWNVGGIVGSAEDPILTLPAVEGGTGASVRGENVGGLVGRLTCSTGDHTLALSVSGLTLEGSGSVGGLFGVFSREEGSVTLDAQAEEIVFADGAEDCGSLIGTYYANSLEDPLNLNGELIADDAGLEAIAGFVDYPGKPEYMEPITAAEEAQAVIDSIRQAELRPGEMSSFWWAVVCGKITAEDLEEEIAAAYSDGAEDQEAADAPAGASFSRQRAASNAQDEEAGAAAQALLEAGISAYTDPTLTWPDDKNKYDITCPEDLVFLSYVTPSLYAKGDIRINVSTTNVAIYDLTKSYDIDNNKGLPFLGLSEGDAFSGSIGLEKAASGTYIKLNRPLFHQLSDKATISSINLYAGLAEDIPLGDNSTALLADTITHDDSVTEVPTTTQWEIGLKGISGKYSLPLVGTMKVGSKVNAQLSLRVVQESASSNEENYAAITDCSGLTVRGGGYLCTTMEGDAQLTVTLIKDTTTELGVPNVSGSGNAGGLVGTMSDGAKLSVTLTGGDSLKLSSVTASNNAGGLIGEATNPVLTLPAVTGSAGITIKSTEEDAGGVIGKLTVSPGSEGKSYNLGNTITGLTVIAKESAGGLFGLLVNGGGTYTISGTNVNVTFSGVTKAGGLIGSYRATKLSDALILDGNTTTSTQGSSVTNYGGLIGYVYENPAYIQIPSGTVKTNQTAKPTCYGGLIAELSDHGHFVQVGGSTDPDKTVAITQQYGTTANNKFAGNNAAGGLVGKMPSGVLDLDVQPRIGSDIEGPDDKRGWVLGDRGNTLVYTTVANWTTPADAKKTNDTGVWGQVLRADQLTGLITVNPDHTVTVKAPVTGVNDNAATISNVFDFAAVALRLQLNPTGALGFETADFDSTKTVSITFSAPIDLNNTGLTGLTRDVNSNVNSTEVFNLTITGNNKTITLPDWTVYASANGHDRQGLIGKAGILNVTGLTVDGYVKTYVLSGDIYAGTLIAEAAGETRLTSVTSAIQMTISGGNSENCAYAGLVAMTSSDVTFTSCQLKAGSKISDETNKVSYVAGFLAYGKGTISITVENCEVHGTVEKTIRPDKYARISGLITTLYDGTFTLNISNLTVSDLTVRVPADFDKTCGGLLGYEWMKTTATISGVTVTNCTLNAGNAQFGGLVYKGSGYWKVGNNTVTAGNGISITNSSFNGYSGTDNPSGLLVCRANEEDDGKGALYLEILNNSYEIGTDVTVTLTSTSGQNFDELAGTTEGTLGNGVVSIATATASTAESPAKIDQNSTCNTYKQQLAGETQYNNPHTRYYYNLNLFRGETGADGKVTSNFGNADSAEKMVLWSAWDYCDSTLNGYFIKDTPRTISGNLDLSGYSYYPVSITAGVTIEEGTVVNFDYQGLETAESASDTIPENKKPSNSNRQHYGMHTGIFTNVGSTTAGASLTINGLTLRGTVGGSAIINGTARGKASDAMTVLAISNVKLDGIRTVTATEGELLPLLINSIESFTKLNLTDVTTTATYKTLTNFTHAATSLIGVVGETSGDNQVGQYIQLDFAQMALDGKTTSSIFSEALFLQEFQYTDNNSWGVYNFTQDEGYTLGRELSNAEGAENVRNGGEQFYFYGTEDYVYLDVDPTAESSVAKAESFFATVYRPYVNNSENGTYHQMDINLSSKDIIKGCGTYSDPYIIEYGKQLSAVAKVLNGQSPKKNWKVTLNTTVLNGDLSSQDGHTSGKSKADKTFTWNGTAWVCDGQDSTADVIKYLRNAYYQLKDTSTEDGGNDGTITLSSGWGGLGSAANPFQGVIVGGGATVHIDVKNATGFGGLIQYSTGSVVKNVTIQYDHAPSIACSTTAPSTIDAPFFGGVVGWCIGGDTIIDGVTVTYNSSPTVTGDKAYLVPVGGYVGMVGGTEGMDNSTNGKGGGVVFRNISSSNLPDVWGDNYFYVNPYVGRVLDGYAIKEAPKATPTAEEGTETTPTDFINTDKNYQIPTLSSPGLTIDSSGNIEVSDGAGLWLLSAIVNSGASATTANEKARFCDYDSVGGRLPDGGVLDEEDGASPYLIRKYRLEALKTKINEGAVSIELTGNCDMSSYGNGFRGIGTSYSANNNYSRLIKVKQLDGGSNTVTLAQNRKEYLDEGSSWTSIGAGLFVRLYQDTSSNPTTIKNLTLKGSTGITYYNGISSDSNLTLYNAIKDKDLYSIRLNQVGAGMLASSVANVGTTDLTIENVTLDDVKVNAEGVGSVFAGGLIGVIWGGGGSKNTDYLTVTLKDCVYTNPAVRGFVDAGGFIGRVRAEKADKYAKMVITYSEAKSLTGGNIETTSTAYDRGNNFSTVGGLIGSTHYYDLAIQPYESTAAMLTVSGLTVKSGYTGNGGDKVFGGGLIGLCYTPKVACTIRNVELEGDNSISGAKSGNRRQLLGGLIGTVTNSFGWNNSGNASVTVSNIHIAKSGSLMIQYTQQAGTLFGILNIGGQTQLSHITIGSNGNSPSVMIANIRNDGNYSNIGGLIGGGNALKDVSLSDVQINNTYVLLDNNTGKTRGAALLFGFIENGSDTASIKIQNLTLKNSYVVTGNQQTRAGFVYGFLNNQNSNAPSITGRNVLIENCRLGYNSSLADGIQTNTFVLPELTTDGTAAGLIGGDCTNSHTTVKLVGVRVEGCTAPAQNFGTTAPKAESYVVRADYSKAAEAASAITTVPTSNISIRETEQTDPKVLTGDGACFTASNSTTPIAETIMRDYYSGITSNTYFSIGSVIGEFATKTGESVTISEKLSTFHIAGEISEEDQGTIPNFPVLVINSNEGSNANSIVQDFITVLTNDTVAPRRISDPVTYQWDSTSEKFVPVSSSSLTLSGSTLTIKPGGYDNQRDQFTLLDVTYADPTGGTTPYHLYIPVIVRRVMQFKFWASADNGSSYNVNHYDTLAKSAIGSNKELITSLLNFEYQWTKEDWQTIVNSGTNLLWNFDKEVQFAYNSQGRLPNSTRLTLVDCNNQDRAYYGTYSSDTVSFSSFSRPSTNGEESWSSSDVPLCDLLKLKEVDYDPSDPNLAKFVKCDAVDRDKTLRIDNQYYRPATSEDTDGPYFGIQVGLNENELVKETYYLTIQTQQNDAEGAVYNFVIQCAPRLKNPVGNGLPTTWIPYDSAVVHKKYTKNNFENRVIISQFYTQTMAVTTSGSATNMSSANFISGMLSADVTFLNQDGYGIFRDYRSGRELQQRFCLSLKGKGGKPVPFPAGTTIEIGETVYPVEPGYSCWLPVLDVTGWHDNSNGKQTATVSTTFTLRFTAEGIYSTFPVTETPETDGILVCASSSLSMNADALKRSNQKVSNEDSSGNRFFRKEISLATLFYNAYDITFPSQASGLSNLGINGWDTDSAALPSAAIYDVSAVQNVSNAKKIRCTVKLLKKNNSGGYDSVATYTGDPGQDDLYLDSIVIDPKVSVGGVYVSAQRESGFDFTIGDGQTVDWHAPVQIDVDLQVRSGNPFEERIRANTIMYANYRVLLTVELLDSVNNPLEGSGAYDYITYTNTRIVKELIP